MPKDVFISYARKASRDYAVALHAELGEDAAFLDSEDIPFGDPFPERLVDALLDSRVVVILAEPVYFTRWYCLLEYRLARTPFLRLAERSGIGQRERDAALHGIVVAMPPGDADPMLERFPAAVQGRNWAPVTEPAAIAALVRARLAERLPTLRERYEALGELGTIREIVLETTLLPGPGRIGQIPLVPVIGLSPSIRDRFVGRAKDIWRLHDVLTTERGEPSAAALTGAIEAGGGFGKTRLALEYLYRFGTRHFRGGLFWINAEQDAESQHYEVVQALDPSAPAVEVLRTAQGGVAGALARIIRSRADAAPPLFVIDNVPEPEAGKLPLALGHWCPVLGEVAVLATSRTRLALGGAGSIVPVQIDTLEPDAAVRLLTAGASREELTEDEWTEIASWVGNLPLALELLNGLLTSGAMGARELLEMSRQQRPSEALDSAMDALRGTVPSGTLRGVTQAFAESYERLTEEEQYAARLIAWMAPAAVPDQVLEALEGSPFTPSVRATLRGRHFVTPPATSGTPGSLPLFGGMHRVLADFLRSQSVPPGGEIPTVLGALNKCIDARLGDERLRVAGSIGPAVAAVAGHSFDSSPAAQEGTGIDSQLNMLCVRLIEVGASSWAHACAEVLVRGLRRILGEEHPSTLTAMNNLAEALSARGDYVGAQEIHEHVLAARCHVLGEEHPDTLTTKQNLATTLWAQGDYPSAQNLEEQVLAAKRRVLGEEHPSTLNSMNNLAVTLRVRGDHTGAREIHERVLMARHRVLGEEHPDTLNSLNNLAEALRACGDFVGAQEMQERVLGARRRILGDEHPATLITKQNLATTLWAQGKYGPAEELEQQVLTVKRRVLGEQHPSTSIAAWHLYITLRGSGKVAEARRVLKENLLWLLERDPETLTKNQQEYREQLLRIRDALQEPDA
jgi:tetratricopeptide (TPR) repeat protein